MNSSTAALFVEQHGDPAQRARLRYIYSGQVPTPESLKLALAGQRPDGGWQSAWAPDYSSIDATCNRLAQAEQLGLGAGEPALMRALYFLAQRQQADGAWEEAPDLSSMAPPWAVPGSREARLYLTANSGYWLARLSPTSVGSLRESAGRAANYLLTYLRGSNHLPSFIQADWLAAGLCQLLGRVELVSRVYTFLESRVPELPAGSLAWLIIALRGAGIERTHPLLASAGAQLATLQAADGHWPSEDSHSRDADATLDALYALKLVGLL
jgi:hypothetical protein